MAARNEENMIFEENMVSTRYSIVNQLERQLNKEEFSDVVFIVGEEKTVIYAIRSIMALGSPVFMRMFYGDLQPSADEFIDIPDLTSRGFMNMLRYIYGQNVNTFELSSMYETYMAGDKYLVHDLVDNLLDHMKNNLDTLTSSIIFDQLLYINNKNSIDILRRAQELIQTETKSSFESHHFLKISSETLIKILSLKRINLSEIDVLKACYRWTKSQCSNEMMKEGVSHMRKIFSQFKNLIRFSEIWFSELDGFDQIEYLLTEDEISSLFLKLLNRSKTFSIAYQGNRKSSKVYNLIGNFELDVTDLHTSLLEASNLRVNRAISIIQIFTKLPIEITGLELEISVNHQKFNPKFKKLAKGGYWCFTFEDYLKIDDEKECDFIFKFDLYNFGDLEISNICYHNDVKMKDGELCTFSFDNDDHPISEIVFFDDA